MFHKIFIRLCVILIAFIAFFAVKMAMAIDPYMKRMIISMIILIPSLWGLFCIKDFGRYGYLTFALYTLGLIVYDWLTAASPFRWEGLDPIELWQRLTHGSILGMIGFGIYLFIPPVRKIFK